MFVEADFFVCVAVQPVLRRRDEMVVPMIDQWDSFLMKAAVQHDLLGYSIMGKRSIC